MSKELNLEILKELGTIGNKKVVICRWSSSDEWKVQTLYEMKSNNFGKYYKGVSSYSLTELNELWKLTKGLKLEDFGKVEVKPEKKKVEKKTATKKTKKSGK